MSKTTNKYSPEVRERAVRMVLSNEGQHESRWSAILSISGKIGWRASRTASAGFVLDALEQAIHQRRLVVAIDRPSDV